MLGQKADASSVQARFTAKATPSMRLLPSGASMGQAGGHRPIGDVRHRGAEARMHDLCRVRRRARHTASRPSSRWRHAGITASLTPTCGSSAPAVLRHAHAAQDRYGPDTPFGKLLRVAEEGPLEVGQMLPGQPRGLRARRLSVGIAMAGHAGLCGRRHRRQRGFRACRGGRCTREVAHHLVALIAAQTCRHAAHE